MTIRRAFLVILVTACLLALVGLAPSSVRAQYDYSDKVLAIEPTHLIAYWPLNELSGTTANDVAGNNLDGTYNGVALDQIDGAGATMGRAGLWDGINDYVDIFSSGLVSAFSVSTGTISVWIKVDASIWTDGLDHAITELGVGTSDNRYGLWKGGSTLDDDLAVIIGRNGTFTFHQHNTTSTGWLHLAGTWNVSGAGLNSYLNGSVTGPTAITGSFVGTIDGAYVGRRAANGSLFWSGYIHHLAIWDIDLPESDIDILADPAGLPTPTPTPTNPTNTPTATLEFGSHIILSSGQVGALYYTIDSGSIFLGLLLLLQIGLLLALLALRMWRRA